MKQWSCVKVDNYKKVADMIESCQKDGWELHTYTCTQAGIGADANHFLLFTRGQ